MLAIRRRPSPRSMNTSGPALPSLPGATLLHSGISSGPAASASEGASRDSRRTLRIEHQRTGSLGGRNFTQVGEGTVANTPEGLRRPLPPSTRQTRTLFES